MHLSVIDEPRRLLKFAPFGRNLLGHRRVGSFRHSVRHRWSQLRQRAGGAGCNAHCCSMVRFSGSRQMGDSSADTLAWLKRTNLVEKVAVRVVRDPLPSVYSPVLGRFVRWKCLPPCAPRPCKRLHARRPLCSRSTSPSRRRSGHPAGVPRHLLPQRGGERRRQPPSHLCHRLLGAAAPLQLLPLVPQQLPREHGRYVIERAAHLHRLPMRSPGMSCSSPRRSRSSRRMGSWSPLGKGRACHG